MSLVGQPAPAFSLLGADRKPVSLADYRGKKVVLAFFPGAFTGVCTKELCTLRDSHSNFEALDAQVLAICVDSPLTNAAFVERHALTFPVLSDYTRATVADYGVALANFAGMPGYTAAQRAVFIVDGAGTVTTEWIAPNPGVEPDYAAIQAALA